MSSSQRPSVRDIIETVKEALREGIEPFDAGYSIVPAYFQIFTHPEAHSELQPVSDQIRKRIRLGLDDELQKLNRRSRNRLSVRLKRLYKRLFERSTETTEIESVVQRAADQWLVDFLPSLDANCPADYIGVLADLVPPGRDDIVPKGANPTRRFTVRLDSSGGYQTAVAASIPKTTPGRQKHDPVFARIVVEGDSGTAPFSMTKTQITVGRFSYENPHVDLRIPTVGDVSREHFTIRYDPLNKRFEIRDLSAFGTSVNGKTLPRPSPHENDKYASSWTILESPSRIGMADVVFLSFQSLIDK